MPVALYKFVIAGSVTGLPANLTNLTMTKYNGAMSPAPIVVASGARVLGGVKTPLWVSGTVVDSTHISFTVGDISGGGYDPANWDGIEIRYAVIEA